MPRRTIILVAVAIALASRLSIAGILSSGISDSDASTIKRLGVISALGDTLMVRSVGLTVFNNKSFKTTLPTRDLDATFTRTMRDEIVRSGRISGEVASLATASLDTGSIIEAAREQGFDAVIVMQPAEDTQFHMTGPGLTVFRTGGGHKSFTCNSMRIVVLRVADGKKFAAASEGQCPAYSNLPFWHNTWEEYTEEERRTVFRAMEVFVNHQIDETLKRLGLHSR